ncbi:MAG: toll/interleukin-1 receptor domain-containing protein [Colwellia sp.]|jgi:SEFIR domain.
MIPPRVFISYSHDSAEHKCWVLNLATTLRNRGVDVVLDQWDLKPGDDLPHFMETELAKCDYAVIICSETYVAKANAGEGGVGYEKMIVTSSLLSTIDNNKIIPIVRQSSQPVLPTFLKSKIYVNFSNNSDVEYSLDELLRTMLNAPLYEKPEIGSNPFQSLVDAKPDRTADGLKAVMTCVAAAFKRSTVDALTVGQLTLFTKMHRLKLERYLEQAISKKLVSKSVSNRFKVTSDGYEYLVNHGIIEA